MEHILDENSESVISMFEKLDYIREGIENRSDNSHLLLNGERYLTDEELSEKIRLSRRTL